MPLPAWLTAHRGKTAPKKDTRRKAERLSPCAGRIEVEGIDLVITIPRLLDSPNTWQGRHWSYKDRLTKSWEQELSFARRVPAAAALIEAVARAPRVRALVTRVTRSRRNFIKDDDNLRFVTKPLNDALVRARFMPGDSRTLLEQPMPEQIASPDVGPLTIIRLRPLSIETEKVNT